jgi:hypothetical protein
MTTKTREELIFEALDQLGILVPTQAPSAEIMVKMDRIVDPILEQLSELGIYFVQDAGEEGPTGGAIESSAFLSIASYIANAAAPKFNLAADTKLKALAIEAEQTLRTLGRPVARRTLSVDPALPTGRSRIDLSTLT